MHKRKITTLLILILFQTSIAFGQNENTKSFWSNSKIELSGTYELFGEGLGFIVKGKKESFSKKHFEGFLGLAFQFSHQSETDKYLNGVKGYNNDFGMYAIYDLVYYPFKTKKIFIAIEPFIGVTNLKSKGTLEISNYDIYEKYSNSYTYYNSGTTQKIGYNFGQVSGDVFVMISSKGLLDNGRKRLGDSDSKIFLGINISYTLKSMK